MNKDIPRTRKCPLNYLNNPVGNCLFLKPTDPKEAEAIILSLNNSKSSGPFSIPIRLLKTSAKGISESYSLIVNVVRRISASFQHNCAKNGKGLKIGTKEADTT